MKIKRVVALALSVIILCFTLVSCDDEIGAYRGNYDWEPEVIEDVYYDFYIVGGESDDLAEKTVNQKLNQILYDKYHTKIVIHYLDEEGYIEQIRAAAESGATQTNPVPEGFQGYTYGGKIVLINDYSMMSFLGDKLAPLDEYLAHKDFGKLNTQIPTPLLSAAEYFIGEGDDAVSKGTLAIPNNRRLGEYEYYVINRNIAENVLSFSAQTELLEMTTDEAAQELIDAADAKGIVNDGDTKYFYKVTGNYEDKAKIEKSGEWICNIAKKPTVTAEMTYESAFGVIARKSKTKPVVITKEDGTKETVQQVTVDYARRAMEIIYSINADVTVRNILQYGVENSNFYLDENKFVTPATTEGSRYNMNIEYTGDVMKAYYFGEVWTPELAENVKQQNSNAVLPE